MATCKDKTYKDIIKEPFFIAEKIGSGNSQEEIKKKIIKNKVDIKQVAVPKQVLDQLENLKEGQDKLVKPPNKIEIPLEKKQLTISDKSFAIGKRKVVIDSNNFGPTAKERKELGVEIIPDGLEIKDNFRFRSGKYWTTDDAKKELLYLSKNVKGEPWSVIDYNFTNTGILIPKDITSIIGISSKLTKEQLDKVSQISSEQIFNIGSTFATQQWVAIKANSPYYVLTSNGTNTSQISVKSNLGLSFKDITPAQAQSGHTNTADLKFSEKLWTADLAGGSALTSNVKNAKKIENDNLGANQNFVPTIVQDEDFYDHCFEVPAPFSTKELENYTGLNNPLFVDISPNYNFLIKKYEEVLEKDIIPEDILPNMYVMISEFVQATNRQEYKDLLTFGGSVQLSDVPNQKLSKRSERNNKEYEKVSKQYFDKLSRKFDEIQKSLLGQNRTSQRQLDRIKKILSRLESKFSNIIVPMDNMNLLKDFNDRKFLFPMYVDLQFSTDKTTTMAEILKDSFLSLSLQKRIANGVIQDIGVEKKTFLNATELLQRKRITIAKEPTIQNIKDCSFETIENRTWDITEWLNDFDKVDDLSPEDAEEARKLMISESMSIVLGQSGVDERASTEPNLKFIRNLLELIFVGKLRKLVKQKMRTFEEMMNGKLAYSETVLYRVEKSLVKSDGSVGETKQNYYFPNSNEIDVLRFIDTQVKYSKEYVYKVYAYQAVIGTKYTYSDLMTTGNLASFLVTQYPSIKLVEVPYFEQKIIVVDSPPVFPDIEAIPYKGINDRILFLLKSNVGDYTLQPIIINPEDEEKFNLYRKTIGLSIEEPIRFKTDDHSGVFQVFRTEKKPKSYKDFEGKMIEAVETDVSKLTVQSATSAAYVNFIEPNKKYYYCFRIVDIHGHISNPSPVYEIEMIDEKGTVYPLIKIVEFDEKVPREKNKTCRKYIQIIPTLAQSIINEEKSGIEMLESVKDVKSIFLGKENESIWNKKFKIRLTSKSTGRKIDFNVNFVNERIRVVNED